MRTIAPLSIRSVLACLLIACATGSAAAQNSTGNSATVRTFVLPYLGSAPETGVQ